MTRSLIIADNHPLFRTGVRQIVDQSGLFEVLAEVGDGDSCVFQVNKLKPDCLILDLNLPGKNGFDVARKLKQSAPDCRVIILSMHSSSEFVEEARQIGCGGFVAKEDAGDELIGILKSDAVAFAMSSSSGRGERPIEFPDMPDQSVSEMLASLTRSETKVLRQISTSKTSREIAEAMNLSERTVHTHRQNICNKLNLTGVNSLVRFAIGNKKLIQAENSASAD